MESWRDIYQHQKKIATRLKKKIRTKNRTRYCDSENIPANNRTGEGGQVLAISIYQVQQELRERQIQQKYQASYSLSLFYVKDCHVYQAFEQIFGVRLQSISILNAGSFVQAISTRTDPNLNKRLQQTRKPTVFDVLLWFYSVNMILNEQLGKKLSCCARINYTTDKIIGSIISKETDACNIIIRRLGHTNISLRKCSTVSSCTISLVWPTVRPVPISREEGWVQPFSWAHKLSELCATSSFWCPHFPIGTVRNGLYGLSISISRVLHTEKIEYDPH